MQAIKVLSKSRLERRRDVLGSGDAVRVVTALDKVMKEISIMATTRHERVVALREVIEDEGDDMFLGAGAAFTGFDLI